MPHHTDLSRIVEKGEQTERNMEQGGEWERDGKTGDRKIIGRVESHLSLKEDRPVSRVLLIFTKHQRPDTTSGDETSNL